MKHAVHDQRDPDPPPIKASGRKKRQITRALIGHSGPFDTRGVAPPITGKGNCFFYVIGRTGVEPPARQAFLPRSRLDPQTPIWPPRAPLPQRYFRARLKCDGAGSTARLLASLLRPAGSGTRPPKSPEPLDQAHGVPGNQAPLRRSTMLQSEGQ
ncbi:hypothetical protein TEQG_06434 [Trichophyton equinum CBS 127.97]|uniref:Uncharacterized protein n=1 Tax=Trichophyton equinum (strain ATCC MYA-4606 / CBS 127.97) TaxID=559882 RepID=F2Q053_TRIEC|nr:hypothetical protein TEQG_06434 [Trichophyton equinum CBS 127.97]